MLRNFDRYVVRLLIKNTVIVQILLTCVTLMVSGFQSLNRFEKYGITFKQIIINELLALPIKINNTLGMGIVIASIVTVIIIMRSKEMLAYICIGGRAARLMVPFIAFAVIASAGMIGFECRIYPHLKAYQNKYQAEHIRHTRYVNEQKLFNLWLIDNNSRLVNVSMIDPFNNTITGYREYNLDESFQVANVRFIEKAYNSGGRWVLNNVNSVDLSAVPPKQVIQAEAVEESPLFDNLNSMTGKRRKELNAAEISKMIRVMKNHGLSAVSYEMILYAIYANGTSVIVMVLLVVPMGMDFSRRYSPLKTSIVSFSLVIAFWIVLSTANSFGYSGILSPLAANILPHILFIFIGLVLLILREKAR